MPSSALHVARTGLEAQDARMRVIANNLANIGTTGFKRDRANFATLAYQENRVAGQQSSAETAYATGLNLGTGVSLQSTTSITTQGTLANTGNPLDLALDGDGYFQVQLPGGRLGYTRAGNFSRSAEGQLVTAQGYPVQPGITPPSAGPLSFLNPEALKAGSQSSFKGEGNANQTSSLSGELAVTIAEVRPNGTALVRGEKRLLLSQGQEWIQFSGIVRLADLDADSRVMSSRVADARIEYSGNGSVQRASREGWLSRFFSKISPF